MSRLVKSYLTSNNGEHIVRIHQIVPQAEPDLIHGDDAENMLERARQEAMDIVREAQELQATLMEQTNSWAEQRRSEVEAEAAVLLETSRREGFEQGYHEGLAAGESEYANKLQSANDLMNQALAARQAFLAESEPLFKTIAIAIAEKLICCELTIRPEVVIETVRTCLREVQDKGVVEVRVHPNDYAQVFSRKQELDAILPGQSEVVVVPDTQVTAGGCLVYTSHGSIDAQIETGLDEIRKALQEL